MLAFLFIDDANGWFFVRRVMNIHVDNFEVPKINILLRELDEGIEVLEHYQPAAENSNNSSAENKAKGNKSSARAAVGSGVVALLLRRASSYSTAHLSFLVDTLKEIKQKVPSFNSWTY